MNYLDAAKKSESNQNMVGKKYIIDTGEEVSVRSVYVHKPNGASEWEVYAIILPKGFPKDDNVYIVDNIDNFKNYTEVK